LEKVNNCFFTKEIIMSNANNKRVSFEELETLRDEVNLQAHLFKEDAKAKWASLEKEWKTLKSSTPTIKAAAVNAGNDVLAAGDLLKESLYSGYLKIRSSLPG
jgi:hypothetical protein